MNIFYPNNRLNDYEFSNILRKSNRIGDNNIDSCDINNLYIAHYDDGFFNNYQDKLNKKYMDLWFLLLIFI